MTRLTPRPTPQSVADDESGTLLPRHDPIERLPVLILFPHNRCNCRCVMCDIWRIRDKQEIAPEEIVHWLSEWRELGVRRVVLSGGEALLHRRLWEIAEALREAGIGVSLLSTGLLLRRHAENVVRFCDDVVVSLDGPREIHDEIRRIPDAFGKLRDGVAAIRAADPERTVRISARCVVQQANCRHLRATVTAAHELDLDSLSFLAVDVSTTAFNRPGGWDAERAAGTAPSAADLPALLHELECLERESALDFDNGFLAEGPLKLRRRLYQHFNAVLGNGEFHPVACNAPWVSSVIESDGTVRPCFFQPALGNIRESGSLTQILNSPDAIAWRQGLDTGRDEICRRCVCSLALRDVADVPEGL